MFYLNNNFVAQEPLVWIMKVFGLSAKATR